MRTKTALTVALVVATVAAVPVAGIAATGGAIAADQHGNSTETNASVAPGERLSGVVGVQEAELEGEVDKRAFGLRVARAATNEARADVVKGQFDDIEGRLADLEERRQELERARENGSMSEGKYRAEVAELAARTQTVEELANRSENAAQGLPADLLESEGINVTAIRTLKERAETLTGPEVAEIARSIAGNAAPVDPGPPEGVRGDGGPPEDRSGQDGADDGDTPDRSDAGQQDSGQQSTTATPTPTPAGDGSGSGSDRGGPGNGGSGSGGSSGSGDDPDGSGSGGGNGGY